MAAVATVADDNDDDQKDDREKTEGVTVKKTDRKRKRSTEDDDDDESCPAEAAYDERRELFYRPDDRLKRRRAREFKDRFFGQRRLAGCRDRQQANREQREELEQAVTTADAVSRLARGLGAKHASLNNSSTSTRRRRRRSTGRAKAMTRGDRQRRERADGVLKQVRRDMRLDTTDTGFLLPDRDKPRPVTMGTARSFRFDAARHYGEVMGGQRATTRYERRAHGFLEEINRSLAPRLCSSVGVGSAPLDWLKRHVELVRLIDTDVYVMVECEDDECEPPVRQTVELYLRGYWVKRVPRYLLFVVTPSDDDVLLDFFYCPVVDGRVRSSSSSSSSSTGSPTSDREASSRSPPSSLAVSFTDFAGSRHRRRRRSSDS